MAGEATPETGRWSQLEMLVAQLIDAVNNGTYVLTVANSDKDARVPQPEPVRRPGWEPKPTATRPSSPESWARLDAMLAASA